MGKCIIIYKGKKYSEEQFKEYFINNKQEFATSIAKNKDVIDSFKRKMESIDYVFSQSPELASIGSKAQYLQYLSTIFPNSKVKDIVYHGANEPIEGEKFVKREGATGGGIWFSGSKRYATNVMNRAPQSETLMGRKLRGVPTMYYALLNMKNPKHFYNSSGALLAQSPTQFMEGTISKDRLHGNTQYDKNINDGVLFHHPNSKKPESNTSAEQVVVFEPEQIHVIGSKNDIEGFKEFVSKDKQTDLREQLALKLAADYSFAVEINTAKESNTNTGSGDEEESLYREAESRFEYGSKEYNDFIQKNQKPTQHYSGLTVLGGINGSYIEANIETPLITPSIKGHSQFSTDNSIGWYRMDEKQNYQEKDIDNLIEIMKKSGILEVNCM